jgi:orotate phosphoribosyltransferase
MTRSSSPLKQLLANARHPELARFLLEKSVTRGDFTLASGKRSSYYVDVRLSSLSGEGAALIADAIVNEINGLDVEAVGGMDMGATPIVSAVVMRLHQLGQSPIDGFVVRKEVKKHGTMKNIEGNLPAKPSRLAIIDDVVTSGESIVKAVDAVRQKGHEVVMAISVLDRNAGGGDRLRAMGLRYQPLVTIAELGLGDETDV